LAEDPRLETPGNQVLRTQLRKLARTEIDWSEIS
jgi:hypothetical protein